MESYTYPDPLASPKEKAEMSYNLQYGKAMYYGFNRSGLRMFNNDRANYQKLIAFAQGNQPIDPYKKRLDVWSDDPGKEVFVNINWQILNIASKFVDIIVDKITKAQYDDICTPIDPTSVNAKRMRRHLMEAYVENEQYLANLGVGLSKQQLGFDPELMPKTSDEMDIHMSIHDKDEFAMEAELSIGLAKQNNDFEQIRKTYVTDMVYLGPAGVEVRNTRDGTTKMKRIDPSNLIVGNSKSEDFKDIAHAGYVDQVTYTELMVMVGDQFNVEQKKEIYQKATTINTGANNNFGLNISGNDNQSDEKSVSIFKYYFKTTNENTYEKKKDARGNSRIYPTKPERGTSKEYQEKYKGEREIIKDCYEVVYEGTWIVGTEFVFNYGLLVDMEVTQSNTCETRIPIHVIAPGFYNGKSVSVVHKMIPALEEIQVNWLQFQHAISKYIPDGQSIDIDGLIQAPIGKAGKQMSPRDVLEMYYKTGILVYKGSGLQGQNGNAKPVAPMSNSNIEKAQAFLQNIFTLEKVLRDITGLNEAADASTPASDALVGTSQIALQGAESALGYLYHGDRMMLKHIAESCVLLTQNAVKRKKISGFVNATGETSARFWEANKDISLREFGFDISPRATGTERAQFLQTLEQAFQKGTLSLEDYLDIKPIKNIKLAAQLMKVRSRRLKKEADEANAANTQQQAQANQETAASIEKTKQATMTMEYQQKLSLEMAIKGEEMKLLQEKYKYEIQLKAMDNHVKLDNKHVEADAKVITKQMEVDGKLEVAKEKPGKAASSLQGKS